MSYTPTRWENGKAPALSAENLNKIEDELVLLDEGFEEVNQALQTVQSDVSELKEADATINQTLQTVQNDVEYLKENGGGNGGNVPTKVSQLENDLGYVTSVEIDELKEADIAINQTLQTVQDDVEYLKENGGGGTGSSNDITETSKTTMPNSCEGRLLFKEIRGKTEQNGNEIKSVAIGEIKTSNGNGNEFSVTFSQPIELHKIGDVQDVIENNVIKRKYKKIILDGSSDEKWTLATGVEQPCTFYCEINDAKRSATTQNALCNAYTFVDTIQTQLNNNECTMYHDLYNNYPNSNWIYLRDTSCANVSELKAKLQANPITVVYELAIPTTSLPIADQVVLNSIKTFDGTTYLEFDSPLQPEFVAEYGTSKVGGVALESKGETQANSENIKVNSENIEELNGVLNVMSNILPDAFIVRNVAEFGNDANLCVKSGIYRVGTDANVAYGNGLLLVFAWLPNVVMQINTSYEPTYMACRTCWYGTWSKWYRISTTVIS